MPRVFCALFLLLLMISCNTAKEEKAGFVKVSQGRFLRNGKPYTFMGTNFWYGINLGSTGEGGDRERLVRELDRLEEIGVKNLRVMAGSEGPDDQPYRMLPSLQTAPGKYNEDLLKGLDFLLTEMAKRDMVAVMCMNNFWNWSGGMGQYLVWAGAADSIPYPPPAPNGNWSTYQEFTAQFYSNEKAVKMFEDHLRFIISRTNSITGMPYREDPAIMSWELANEPRGVNNKKDFSIWLDKTSAFIKSLDTNHLVTTGSEGNTSNAYAGTDMVNDHVYKGIDYATIHIWVQNWGYYDPAKADSTYGPAVNYAKGYLQDHLMRAAMLGKPVVLEEYGISRDLNNHAAGTPVTIRDQYYTAVFDMVAGNIQTGSSLLQGVNFWAWAGEGRPAKPEGIWKKGDQFIGDPPHETQGWYSVYDTDSSTIRIIREHAVRINAGK
ncbi:MAG: cellulase family glycosylhydrolase [Chitinophagaceae bacterium]